MPCFTKVRASFRKWSHRRTFSPRLVNILILALVGHITICEVCSYKLIQQSVTAGDLPLFSTDLAIVVISLAEAFLSPFLGWLGSNYRRTVLQWTVALLFINTFVWLVLPTARPLVESEFCGSTNYMYAGYTAGSMVRLLLLMGTGLVFAVGRAIVWAHGFATIEERAPNNMSLYYGVVVVARVIALLVGYNTVTHMIDQGILLLVLGLAPPFLFKFIKVFFVVPHYAPEVNDMPEGLSENTKDFGKGFFSSVGRVLSNSFATTQMLCMGCLAAALWGFGYYQKDIIKVNYHIVDTRTTVVNVAEVFSYQAVVYAVIYAGVQFSAVILPRFCRLEALKQALKMSILAIVLYVVMVTALNCDKGNVASSSVCSMQCGVNCQTQWEQFSPVCTIDDMTTYLSPCHAGCNATNTINGIRVFSGCACGAGGRATVGACSDVSCSQFRHLHHVLYYMLVMFTVLALQVQGVMVLRSVDIQDKATALGITGSFVAMISFVIGHMVYYSIQWNTCVWFDGGRCHMQSRWFPLFIGLTSAVLVLLSTLITIVTFIALRRRKRKHESSFRVSVLYNRPNESNTSAL